MQYLIMGAGAAGLCAYTFYRSVLAFLFLLPVAFLYPVYKKKDLKKERIRRLTLQFKEGIMVLASFLSAGYSLENSLSLSVKELEGLYGQTDPHPEYRCAFPYQLKAVPPDGSSLPLLPYRKTLL